MSRRGARVLRVAALRAGGSRALRGGVALLLGATVSATGLVALSGTAHADPVTPTITSPTTPVVSKLQPRVDFTGQAGAEFGCGVTTDAMTPPATYADCTSPWTPALGPDGTYTLWVREQDNALGTASLAVSATWTLDTAAQLSVTPPASPGRDPRPHWDVSTEPGALVSCVLDSDPPTDCTTVGVDPASDLSEGTHTLVATATDQAGNTASSTTTYELDTTAPGAPTVTGDGGSGNTAPTWTWTNSSGYAAKCTLTTPTGAAAETDCTTPTSYTPAVGAQGDYSAEVVLVDDAGNRSAPGQSPTYTLDTVAPAAATGLTLTSTSPSNDPSTSWTFNATSGATTTCHLVGATHPATGDVPCSSPFTATVTADDSWSLVVTETDAVGNAISTTSTSAFVYDTTGPNTPLVSGPSGVGNDATPTVQWTGDNPSPTALCRYERTDTTPVSYGPWVDCYTGEGDVTLPADGSYVFQAQLADTLGNLSGIGTSSTTYTYDGTPPPPPTLTTPSTPGNDPHPQVTFADPAPDGHAECAWSAGTAAPASPVWSTCPGQLQPALPSDGSYVLEARVVDAAGNPSTASVFVYVLDTSAPTAVTVTGPTGPSNDRQPHWVLGADPADAVTCRLYTGTATSGTPLAAATGCTTSYDGDLTGLVDGLYTLRVTARDTAGNTTTTDAAYTLDTTAPAAPSITLPAGTGNAANPVWRFVPQAGTTAECRLVSGISPSPMWTPCDDGTFTVTNIADGTYTVDVQVTDTAGNPAPLASSAAYTSDRTAPAAPTVTGPAGPGHDTSPVWHWTADEAGLTATCRLDIGGNVGTPVACDDGSFPASVSTATSYVVVVVLKDAAGNTSTPVSSVEYDLDTTPPATPTVSGQTGPSRSTGAIWTWVEEPGATSSCVLVAGGVPGSPFGCVSGQTFALGADGTYVLRVAVTDAAGNTGGTGVSAGYVLDTAAPAAPAVTTPTSPSTDRTPSFGISAESGATLACRWRQLAQAGSTVVHDWAPCTAPYVADLAAMPDADYVLDVRATDTAGNTSAVGSSLAYRLDTTAPAAPVVTLPASPSTDPSPTVTWTGEAGTTATCTLSKGGTPLAPTACATPWTAPLTSDGSWTVAVTLTDAAGSTSAAGTAGPYVLDTTAPSDPVLTAPTSPSNDTRPTWSATTGTGDTTECALSGPAGLATGYAPCAFPYTTDLTGRPDGTYTLSVRAVDEVGLRSGVVTGTYALDTTTPGAPTVTADRSSGSSLAPGFTFTAEPGSATRCAVTSGATTVRAAAPCTSPVTADMSGQVDGVYALEVTATDAAGNTGPTGSATYVLDRAAPAAPVLTITPATPSPLATPSFGFTAEAGATTTCTVTDSAGATVVAGPCTSPFTPTLPADDTYTVRVTATDAAGNTGPALTVGYVLDTTAPAAPAVAGPASPSQSTTPHWDVTVPEGRAECQLTGPAGVVSGWSDCSGGFTGSLTDDGSYTLSVRTVDPAGNTSGLATSTYVLDRSAPAAATVVVPPSPSNGRTPVFTVTGGEDGLTAACTVTTASGPASVPCSAPTTGAPVTLDLSSATDGPVTLTVVVTDAAGNSTSSTSEAYLLDTTPPNLPLITAPASPGSDRTVTWTLTGDVDATLQCRLMTSTSTRLRSGACGGAPTGAGSFTADLTTSPDGDYTLQVRAKDAAGNYSTVASSTYTLDTTAPAAPTGLTATTPSPSNRTTVTFTFGTEPGSSAVCQLLTSTAVVQGDFPCSSPQVVDLSGRPDATYSLQVKAVDAAGNAGPSVSADYTLDRTAPAAPVITKTPGSPSPLTDPAWTVEAADTTDELSCRLLGLAGSDWAPCTDEVVYHLAPATSGSYTLQVRETDAAGNASVVVSAAPYVLDSNAPVPPVVTPPAPSPGNSKAPVFTIAPGKGPGADITSMTCTVTRFDGLPSTATPCAFGKATVALTGVAPRTTGLVTLSVKGKDAAGNASGAASASYIYDSVPPAPVQFRPGADVGTSPGVSWSFGEPAADRRDATASLGSTTVTYACQLVLGSGVPSGARSKPCTSPHEELLSQAGTWSLWVWALDAAGNRSAPTASRYTFVSPVPAVTGLRTPASGPDPTPTWTFSVPGGYAAVCLLTGPTGAVLATASCSDGDYTADLTRQPHGAYALTVQLLNGRGDEGPYTKSSPYLYRSGGGSGAGSGGSAPGSGGRTPTPSTPAARTPAAVTPRPLTGEAAPHASAPGNLHPARPSAPTKVLGIPAPGGLITKEATKAIGNTLAQVAKKPTIPLLLLAVVVGFLLLQNRIDRRDPKLASAPVGAEPELDFGPVQGLSGGAPA